MFFTNIVLARYEGCIGYAIAMETDGVCLVILEKRQDSQPDHASLRLKNMLPTNYT